MGQYLATHVKGSGFSLGLRTGTQTWTRLYPVQKPGWVSIPVSFTTKNALIPWMTEYQWSEKAITAFAQLFTELELHPLCHQDFGKRALIIYQARDRREWHDPLKLGMAFNIGVINESLLQNTYRQLLNQVQLLSLSEVSLSLFPFLFSC